MKKLPVKILGKALLSFAILYWLLRQSNWPDIWRHTAAISLPLFMAINFVQAGAIFINTVKWRLFLPGFPLGSLYKLNFIVQFFYLVLPGQLFGDAAKIYRLGLYRSNAEQVAASVIADKISGLGGLFLAGLAGFAATRTRLPLSLFMAMALALFLLFVLTMSFRSGIPVRIISKLPFRKPVWPVQIFLRVGAAVSLYFQKPAVPAGSLFLGTVYQVLCAVVLYLVAQGVSVEIPCLIFFGSNAFFPWPCSCRFPSAASASGRGRWSASSVIWGSRRKRLWPCPLLSLACRYCWLWPAPCFIT
jgi:uncharacterized membrane protein YbhN (UPF0104 family)